MSRARRTRGFSRHEVFVQACFVAAVLWSVALFAVWLAPGAVDRFGRVKGTDFAHFYTLGDAARDGRDAQLNDAIALHSRQESLVAASAGDKYLVTYPPQMALVFLPLSFLPYGFALVVWSVFTALVYACAVRYAWQDVRGQVPDGRLVFVIALGFPPFWNLVLHGQTTALIVVAFCLSAWALARQHRVMAGVALGLLWLKPPFAPLAVVFLIGRREWAALCGLALSVAAQVLVASLAFGADVWLGYVDVIVHLDTARIEPRPGQLHSVKALTDLLPGSLGSVAWLAAACGIAWLVFRMAGAPVPATVSVALLVMATVLASPHLTVYDATVLAPSLLRVGGWLAAGNSQRAVEYWRAVYWLFVAFLLPTAHLVGVQASVIILVAVFWLSYRAVIATCPARRSREGTPRFL